MTSRLTAFVGVIGSGKDYSAEKLQSEGRIRVDFKDGLLDMASDLCGYDVRADYDFFKRNVVGIRRSCNPLLTGAMFHSYREQMAANPDIMTGRRLLQRLGTDVMRRRDPLYWVSMFQSRVRALLGSGNDVVCADCRFLNEVEAIRALGGEVRFCDYRSSRYDASGKHESEALAVALLKIGLANGQLIEQCHVEKAADELSAVEVEL